MSNIKTLLTKIFLQQANLPAGEDDIHKKLFLWWKNPRDKIEGGLTLTEEGFNFLNDIIKLKNYSIPLPKDFVFTTQVVLWLDKFLDCPHY